MKRTALLLAGAAVLGLAACKNETASTGWSQAQIDSAVNARVDSITMVMTAQNDSLINAMAMMKADSMMAAMKGNGKAVATTKPTTKPPVTVPAPTTTKPSTGGVTDRPGADNGTPKPVTDRPGATKASDKPKPVTDRPGATPVGR